MQDVFRNLKFLPMTDFSILVILVTNMRYGFNVELSGKAGRGERLKVQDVFRNLKFLPMTDFSPQIYW